MWTNTTCRVSECNVPCERKRRAVWDDTLKRDALHGTKQQRKWQKQKWLQEGNKGRIAKPKMRLYLEEKFPKWLAYLLRGLWNGRIPYRDNDDWLFRFGHLEEFVAKLGIEVAHPAGAKPLLCGCQAKVLHGDGHIDVAMRLAVRTHPFLLMEQGSEDIQGSFVKPRARIA